MNRLSAEVFQEIVASLRSDEGTRGNEKRNRPRVGLRSTLEIFPLPGQSQLTDPIIVWVRDLSADGLGMVSPKSLPIDTQFIAEFHRTDRVRLRVQYRVAYCKTLSRGLHSVGAKLVLILPEKPSPFFCNPMAKSV